MADTGLNGLKQPKMPKVGFKHLEFDIKRLKVFSTYSFKSAHEKIDGQFTVV
jgi:hypothetical protein